MRTVDKLVLIASKIRVKDRSAFDAGTSIIASGVIKNA
jgi:hypothetical protein